MSESMELPELKFCDPLFGHVLPLNVLELTSRAYSDPPKRVQQLTQVLLLECPLQHLPFVLESNFARVRLSHRRPLCPHEIVVVGAAQVGRADSKRFRLLPVPLLVSGMALVHYSADALQLNASSVFIMYVGLFMFSPIFALLLVCLGFVDSHWDLRVRLADIVDRTPKE